MDGRRRGEEEEEGGVELRRAASILLPTLADRASKGSTLSLAHSVSRYEESAVNIIVLQILLLSHACFAHLHGNYLLFPWTVRVTFFVHEINHGGSMEES